MPFRDRRDAGRQLASRLEPWRARDTVVVALPRGGVPVGYEVATALDADLDVLVVRKIGCPWQPELGLGAIGEGGVRLLNTELITLARVTKRGLEDVIRREEAELERRLRQYRGDRAPVPLAGRVAILVDDGLATGFTARAGIEVLRSRGAREVVLAVPVAPAETVEELRAVADEVVCVETPTTFMAIGQFYDEFLQTTDDEVVELLSEASRRQPPSSVGTVDPRREVEIVLDGDIVLAGELSVPVRPVGQVIFAHGSGSSRLSPRNLAVARALNDGGLATLLFDLLTTDEARDRSLVFDIELLARRLVGATNWVTDEPEVKGLRVGLFGASTGAAAALSAAAWLGERIGAVVSRGGRPDLAGQDLRSATAPTLLVVGSRDDVVLELNQQAQALLRCPNRLEVVPGATHLFEEPGALERVADLARDWFTRHLATIPVAETVTLRDGTRVLIRSIATDDSERLRDLFGRLSDRTRYFRYHAAMPRMSKKLLAYLTDADQHDHVALIALDSVRGGQIAVADARYVCTPKDPRVAEVAITVADEYQGRGLGTLLLGLLAQHARESGVTTFRSYVLGENATMLELLDELGATRRLETDGVYAVDMPIPEDPADLPDTPAGRVLRAIAAGRLRLHPSTSPAVRLPEPTIRS